MYLKLNRNARLFLKSPATGTVSLDGDHRTAESLVGDHRTSAFALGDNTPQNDAPRAATLSQLSAAAIAGVGAAIDRRAYVTRARVTRVTLLAAKWACLTCGCDAGLMGAGNAMAASALGAVRRKARAVQADGGGEEGQLETEHDRIPVPPTDIAGCAACRPPPERFRSPQDAQRHTQSVCGFEVELGTTMSDGSCSADCWIAGDAGAALLPPGVKNAVRQLAMRHGRVTCKFDVNAAGTCVRALPNPDTVCGPVLTVSAHYGRDVRGALRPYHLLAYWRLLQTGTRNARLTLFFPKTSLWIDHSVPDARVLRCFHRCHGRRVPCRGDGFGATAGGGEGHDETELRGFFGTRRV